MDKLKKDSNLQRKQKEYIKHVNISSITHTEKRLFTLRNRHAPSTTNVNPIETTNVIYCIYNVNNYYSKLYVGQTTRTAYTRFQQEINTANSLEDDSPLSQFIKKTGRYNLGVFVLQHVDNPNYLHHYERKWIFTLQLHVKNHNKKPLYASYDVKPLTNNYRPPKRPRKEEKK